MQVYFSSLSDSAPRDDRLAALRRLLPAVGYFKRITKGELVAIKTHFGEAKDGDFIPPWQLEPLVAAVRERGATPFLVETSVLYKGQRSNAPCHLELARRHGFFELDVPIVMLDGLLGRNERSVEMPAGALCGSVNVAADVAGCDHMIVASHVTGHLAAGMGACIKNLGMGLSSRKGKLQQHSGSKLKIDETACTGCGLCAESCPEDAIAAAAADASVMTIDEARCIGCGECLAVCRCDAVKFRWSAASEDLQRRMAEHALGAYLLARRNMVFFNFLVTMTKDCDCLGKSEKVYDDVGVLASLDPVAIDQASIDLVRERHGCRFEARTYAEHDAGIQIEHAEKVGLGKASYELVRV